jgi:tRNA (guanine-N7-)-methyltransferase
MMPGRFVSVLREAGKTIDRRMARMLTPRGLAGLIGAMEQETYPEPVVSSLLYRPGSFFERLELSRLFQLPQPVEVELGCGDSSFVVELAGRTPQRNFLGVERLLGRLRKLDRKGRRLGLKNLRGLRIEAGYCLEYLLPPASLSGLHVYFPDPWPKRKHWGNRLINPHFAELAARVLLPGAAVYLRTDDATYFEQMTGVFGESSHFRPVETPAEIASILTDFEREFLAQGKLTRRAAYERI